MEFFLPYFVKNDWDIIKQTACTLTKLVNLKRVPTYTNTTTDTQ